MNPFQHMFSGGNRSFNQGAGHQHMSPALGYGFNPFYNQNGVTGQWQPVTMTDAGAIRVDIGTGIQISATVDNIAVTGGNINVNGFEILTGQVAQLQVAVNALTGTITSKWEKTKTAGYADTFSPLTGTVLINKVQGYSKTSTQPSFIMLFDSATVPAVGSVPDFVVATQPNNYFLDLAEDGVEFVNGLTMVNSSTADVYTPYVGVDFTASVIYKR